MNTLIAFWSLVTGGSSMWLLTEWLDILVKSIVILAIPTALSFSAKYGKASSLLHSVWFQSLIAVALLPIVALLLPLVGNSYPHSSAIIEIEVSTGLSEVAKTSFVSLVPDVKILLLAYLIPLITLFALAIKSYLAAYKISRNAKPCQDNAILQIVDALKESLSVTVPVTVKLGQESVSPFSFGFRNPQIILPTSAAKWSRDMKQNVLTHEVSHIARSDWLSMVIAQTITCLNWFNPICWLIKSRLMEEAEISCDSEVLNTCTSDTEYAENLITIAKQCRKGPELLAHMLVGKSKLRKRINLVLEGNMKTIDSKNVRNVLGCIVALVTLSIGSIEVLAANTADQEYEPIYTQAPAYPTSAADEGITGWVWMEFTVLASGLVDPASIVLLDESASGVFTDVSSTALSAFEFNPRVVNGAPVDVPGVQYVFRFELEE